MSKPGEKWWRSAAQKMCGMQNLPSCIETIPCALLNLLTWLKGPILQSSGQIPLNPSQSCSPTAQPDFEMQFHRQNSSRRNGTEPWPSSPLCSTNKKGFLLLQRVGLELLSLCATEAESKSLIFAKWPDVPGETMAPKEPPRALERTFLFIFPALQNNSYQLS